MNNNDQAVYMFVHGQAGYSPTGFTSWSALREFEGNPLSRFKLISGAGGMDRGRLSMYYKLANVFGSKRTYLSDDNYTGFTGGGTTGANPSVLFLLYAGMLSQDGSTNFNADSACKVTITMYVELFSRIDRAS